LSPKGLLAEYLYGVNPVTEALLARRRKIKEIWLVDKHPEKRRAKIMELAQIQGIKIQRVSAQKLRSYVGQAVHQGVLAVAETLPLVDLAQVLPPKGLNSAYGIWLFLDNITDPNNFGAIIRTALCAGVKAVIFPKDRSALPTPAVSKASAGALEHILLCRVTNLAETLKKLKNYGVWVAGLDAGAADSLYRHDLKGPLALVVGGEEKGIRPIVKRQCDFLLSIPQMGPVSSLNASAAAAIVIFEVLRQHQNGL
jgi:23S rRNA (guanosine2251-2'-O)-methyltransferase